MELSMRKDVPVEQTWDLSLIYKTEEDMLEEAAKAERRSKDIADWYPGRLKDPKTIDACLSEVQEVNRLMYLTCSYAELASSVDYYDTHAQDLYARLMNLNAEIDSRLSFVESEIIRNPQSLLDAAIELAEEKQSGNAGWLRDILRNKPHQLSPETEMVLSALTPTMNTPYQIYNMTKLADMKFPSFTAHGKAYPLGYSLFEDEYEYERDTEVRRGAFDAFSREIRKYENTTAAAYNAYVTNDRIMAKLRGFDDVFDYLLFGQKVTREMYDRQIDLITEKLAPHMRKYAKLLQRVHGLEHMTFADLKLVVDPDYDPRVSIAESKKYVKEGLSILGEEYGEMIEEAYRDRWIDFARNQGKSTGGFCASPYGKGSFILLSWNDRMADVFTIAHELGHAGHFASCNASQSLYDTNVSSYFVESPSTMNELLMAHHMLKISTDPRFRRWVLSCMISNTYYHNFVTHLLEAWYQREVYRLIEQGGSVSAEVLNDLYRKNLENFWGDAVEINEGAELTWMRQPHYYMGLYSYTYSAGLTVATQVCKRIETEGMTAVEDWKKVLAAGSTLDPVGLAALAGVDITTDQPLLATIDYLGEVIDEICQLTEELEKSYQ